MHHHGFRYLSRAMFMAYIINLFTLGCATESRSDLLSPLVDAFVTEDSAPSAVPETNDTAELSEPDVGMDITPGPDVEPDHECDEDEDCESLAQCGEASCFPTEGGVRKCFVLPKANFCDDDDACTIDSCNTNPTTAAELAEFGCSHKVRGCDDHNACTVDICDNTVEGGCISTTDPFACNDNNACTKDTCLPGGSCGYTSETCDDGDETTIDGCVAATGCYHTLVECTLASECLNPDPCQITACVFGKCISNPLVCEDGISCTNDACIGGICTNIPNCEDNSVCTDPVCNLATSTCQNIPVPCNDNNPCTQDFCAEGFGCDSDKIAGCCQDATECQDGDACTFEFCDLAINSCVADYIKVDDGIKCTVDACLVGGFIDHHANDALCLNKNGTPLEDNKTKCDFNYGCVECKDYLDCNDNDPCTYDYCFQNVCTYEARCNAPEVCVVQGNNSYCELPKDFCIADGQCNDYNLCTEDTCLDSFCEHNPNKVCDDGDKCTVDSCHPVYGCVTPNKDCNDNDVCTTYDHCNPATGECEYKKDVYCIQCDSNSDCVAGTICVENASVAYSGACNNGSCFYGGVEVCKNSPCDISICSDGNCTWQPKDCDDKSACTLDLCNYSQGCEHFEESCNDYNACTNDSCNPTVGCVHTWNYSLCSENEFITPCKGYWNCKECDQTSECADNDPATLDQCVPKLFDHICLHKSVTDTFGVGLGNFSQENKKYSVDIQWSDGSFYQNMLLNPGTTLYNNGYNKVKVFKVLDLETGEELDKVPYAIACINYDGILVTGVSDTDGVFTCQ